MDKYLRTALRSATIKLADFVADNFIFLFLFGCLIGLLVTAAYWDWSFWGEATYQNGQLTSLKVDRGRIIQQSLVVVGGFVALFLAMWRTWTAKIQADTALQQVQLAERGQNTERFVKAVEMLSSESATQRRAVERQYFRLVPHSVAVSLSQSHAKCDVADEALGPPIKSSFAF
jgi:hypothetical protein